MADNSRIQWTDASWTVVTGCDRVSPGCAHCYALEFAPRLKAMALAAAAKRGQTVGPDAPYMRDGDPQTSGPSFGLQMHPDRLDWPLRWKRGRRIFVTSMGDLFHPEVTDAFLDRVWAVMALAPQHTFQVLTKRPERMREYLATANGRIMDTIVRLRRERGEPTIEPLPHVPLGTTWWPLPNVWLGTSVENARWRTRIDDLRETPAAMRFLSCEPLLGPLVEPTRYPAPGVDDAPAVKRWIDTWEDHREPGWLNLEGIGWVIIGGESGPGARRMDTTWVRDIIEACREQGASPFVKQMGDSWSRAYLGRPGHAGKIETFPPDLRVRETPAVPA